MSQSPSTTHLAKIDGNGYVEEWKGMNLRPALVRTGAPTLRCVTAKGGKQESKKMDMKAMMDIYMKLAVPGSPHKHLEEMVGSWTTRTVAWMEEGRPPMESKGTCEQKMILGGRFLQRKYTGDMMGTTFNGINIIGYDNHTKNMSPSGWIPWAPESISLNEKRVLMERPLPRRAVTMTPSEAL